MVSDKYITKYKQIVLDSLIFEFNVPPQKAKTMIQNSTFHEILEDDPEFVGHYPPEYWANNIFTESHFVQN